MIRSAVRAFTLVLGAVSVTATAECQVQFVPLPFGYGSHLIDADGDTAVLYQFSPSDPLNSLYRWRRGSAPEFVAQRPTGGMGALTPRGISDDGNKFVFEAGSQPIQDLNGNVLPPGSYLWEAGTGLARLPDYTDAQGNTFVCEVKGISGNGDVVFGNAAGFGAPGVVQWVDLGAPTALCASPGWHVTHEIQSTFDGSDLAIDPYTGASPDRVFLVNGCIAQELTAQVLGFQPHGNAISPDGQTLGIYKLPYVGYLWSVSGGLVLDDRPTREFLNNGQRISLFDDVWTIGTGWQTPGDYLQAKGASGHPLSGFDLRRSAKGGNAHTAYIRWSSPLGALVFHGVIYVNVPPPGKIGSNYCGPSPFNSSGYPGLLNASGTADLASNNLVLEAAFLPSNQFGYVLISRGRDFIAAPAGSMGNLCLGGGQPIGRQNAANQIGYSGSSGQMDFAVDSWALSTPSGPVTAQVGETWHFQVWHRDFVAGASTSNFTDAVSITFE